MTAAWSGTPKTWSTGALGTAADLNTEVRDRMEYLKLSIINGNYIHIRDEKTSGTYGGTFTSGAWQTRDLNTEVADAGGHASLASNQITLAAGTYLVDISAPGYAVAYHQARLYDVTHSTVLLVGTSERCGYSGSTDSVQTRSQIKGVITLASSTVLAVQHQCQTTLATNGFGYACGFGNVEVYTVVELIRVGD